MSDEKKFKNETNDYRWWLMASLKLQKFVVLLVSPVFIFGFLGYWLDKKFFLFPLFFSSGVFSGFIISIYLLYKFIIEKNGSSPRKKS
jgi:hypothetical protein